MDEKDKNISKEEQLFTHITALVFVVVCTVLTVVIPLIMLAASSSRAVGSAASTPLPAESAEPLPSITSASLASPSPANVTFVKTAVFVDGVEVGVLASREAADSVTDEIIAYYESLLPNDAEYSISTELLSEITFKDAPDATAVVTMDALVALLISDDSPEPIMIQSMLTQTKTEPIKHTNEIIKDKYLVKGTRIVTDMGRDGEKQTLTTTTYENGEIKGKPVTDTVITAEPKNGIIRVGTQEITDSSPGINQGKRGVSAEGLTFIPPVSGSITANYGQLGGILHLGLDYDAKSGAAVYASCGGTVVSVLVRGGYGLTVEIDHGNGFLTRYAQLASTTVVLGDVVTQGDQIGLAGRAENSEGASIHFELRIDGEAYNPRYYLEQQ